MTTIGFEVDWTGIRRQLRKNGDSFVHVMPMIDGIKGCPPEVITDVTAAVETANTAMEDDQGQEIVWAADPVVSPAGPIIHIKWPGDEEAQTREWLDRLATALAAHGRTGTVKAARYADLPREIGNNATPHPAAYLAYSLTNPLAPLSGHDWLLTDAKADEIITDAAAWVTRTAGTCYFSENAFQLQVNTEDIQPLFRSAMPRTRSAVATCLTPNGNSARTVDLSKGGQATFDVVEKTVDWRKNLPILKGALLRDPAALDIGVIRSTRIMAGSWTSIGNSPTPLPSIPDPGAWDVNRHMWSRFVPDAHAVQVLTPAHLERANDLSAWDVTQLPGDRWLVETRDLAAWFDNGCQVPDDVLNRTRQDFGAMIITTADIEDDPNGWLGGPRPPARA